jgi:transposase InsO family protein
MKFYRDGYSKTWICQAMQVSRQWLNKWIRRWLEGGRSWKALDNEPPIPKTIHRRRDEWADQILELRKKFPHFGAHKLKIVGEIPLNHNTIHAVLQENGACKRVKRIRRKYKRFTRPFPNYLWQIDITQVETKKDGWVFIFSVVDDHSRFLLAKQTHKREPGMADAIRLVQRAVRQWGRPRQILTDRGGQFTHQGDTPSLFTQLLEDYLGIEHIMGRPHHPRTQGKVERVQGSTKHEWLYRPEELLDQAHVERLLDEWFEHYNAVRPHWSLNLRTPAEVFLGGLFLSEELARAVNEVSG